MTTDRSDIQTEENEEFSADEYIVRKKKAPEPQLQVTPASLAKIAGEGLELVREKAPLVQCMTNLVAVNFTANALLALGASPVMTEDSGESTQCAGVADAVLVNVGTITKTQAEAMRAAVARANASQKPWTLDPVAAGVLPLRGYVAKELMRRFPSVIRGNASEILALSGLESNGRGVDSVADGEQVAPAAKRLAGITRAAVLMTGPVDYVCGENAPIVSVANGDPLLTRVTGMGCAQGALASAFTAVFGRARRFEAAVTTALVTAVAGEMAAAKTKGPGSFAAAFLDALYEMKPADLAKRAKIAIVS